MSSPLANQGGNQPGGAPPPTNEAGGPRPAQRQQPLLTDQGAQQAPQATRLSSSFMEKAFPSLYKIKPTEVVVFSRQLATLINTGIPLLSGLELLIQQVGSSRMFKAVLQQIANDLSTGFSFAQAVNMHPTVFSEIYRRTLTVGERTGSVDVVLRQLADLMDNQRAMSKKFGGAMTYPIIVLGVGGAVGILLTTTALPPLVDMFTSLEADLPLPTRILIGFSHFINSFILYILLFLVVGAIVGAWGMKQPAGRRALDRFRLYAPVLGPPALMGEMARFSRTLSTLVVAGVSLQEIFEMLPATSSNSVIRAGLNQVRDGLMLGQGLSGPMNRVNFFPPLLIQMVSVGEESNSLGTTMEVVANFYEDTAGEKLEALVQFITPGITIFVSGIAAFIALSVIMPMYSITGSFGD